jgi:hypothetical protein
MATKRRTAKRSTQKREALKSRSGTYYAKRAASKRAA